MDARKQNYLCYYYRKQAAYFFQLYESEMTYSLRCEEDDKKLTISRADKYLCETDKYIKLAYELIKA